jgi:hypothetical protein
MAKFAPSPSGFISGPWTDGLFLIGAPLLAALIYLPFHLSPVMNYPLADVGSFYYASSLKNAFMGVVISSHLVIVFARSYANAEIFRMHPLRFTVVPAVLFAAMISSPAFLASVGILAIWWDVYHSSLQTFGIGRIYDRKQGNDANVGRRLDYVLALLIYAGPILGGASLFLHIANHDRYRVDTHGLPMAFFDRVPAAANQYAAWLTWGLLAFAIPFCAYYVYAYWRLHQKGYRVSLQKVLLLVTLAPVSLVCWGFNSFSEAFFVMNFLHSWQYFFLVWHTEGDNLTSRFRLDGWRFGRSAALSIFLFLAVGFGVWATLPLPAIQFSGHTMLSILMLVAILHFWYDGFIWSVRRGHVRF